MNRTDFTFSAQDIVLAPGAKALFLPLPDAPLTQLWTDTRWMGQREEGVFFAIKGLNHDGHLFLPQAVRAGIKTLVVSSETDVSEDWGVNVILVQNPVDTLQWLAGEKRKIFRGNLAAITGSNGKTTIKDWVWQLLVPDFSVARNPGSFNSQTGVPLSLWTLNESHDVGVFEVGISMPGEMDRLRKLVTPQIGLLTRMGDAHGAYFPSFREKLSEKLLLFKEVSEFIYLADDESVRPHYHLFPENARHWSYGQSDGADLRFKIEEGRLSGFFWEKKWFSVDGPTDLADIENMAGALLLAIRLGGDPVRLASRVKDLRPVALRMDLRHGLRGMTLISDVYSFDAVSLRRAMSRLLVFKNRGPLAALLTDFPEKEHADAKEMEEVLNGFIAGGLQHLFWVGARPPKLHQPGVLKVFTTAAEAFSAATRILEERTILLIKGARPFQLEQYLPMLEQHAAPARMEVDMQAVLHNLWHFRNLAGSQTRLMVMAKAGAYGTGDVEVAHWLQTYGVNYLAVAQVDEGVRLRLGGIHLPILVLNPHADAFARMVEHRLEPELYSLSALSEALIVWQEFSAWDIPVHLKWNTGMNRLGLEVSDLKEVVDMVLSAPQLKIGSVFSHLVASEDPDLDEFTRQQIAAFNHIVGQLKSAISQPFLAHLANTGAIHRFPESRLDMVRVGIGLYGYSASAQDIPYLREAVRCTTTILQVRTVPAGSVIGYGGHVRTARTTKVATLALGYADGFPRRLGEGIGKFLIQGRLCPVLGKVCMDLVMVDVTDLSDVQAGEPALWFGPEHSLRRVAQEAGTIPYDILTGIGQRVVRMYSGEW